MSARLETARVRQALEAQRPTRMSRVPVDKIRLHQANRPDLGDLRELVESIRHQGLDQPITLQQRADWFEVVDGTRRFTAAKLAGLRTVPAIIRVPRPSDEVVAATVSTDIHKKPLSRDEKRAAVRYLRSAGWSVREMADYWGVAESTVYGWTRDTEPSISPAVPATGQAPTLHRGSAVRRPAARRPQVSALALGELVDRWERRCSGGLDGGQAAALLGELRALTGARPGGDDVH